jgi:peptidyl-prolyl cis-trans isomerase B (cyclophilin B)
MASTTANRENSDVTRRDFLRVAGGATMAACGLALAGCGTSAPAASTTAGSAGSAAPTTSAPVEGSGSAAGSAATEAATTEPEPEAEPASSEDVNPEDLVGTASDPDADLIYAVAPDDPYGKGKHHVSIEVANYGTMELTLDADSAPITTSNFCRLANLGFYDGLTFFRVIAGFMIQGGDPFGNGTGGATWNIKGEFRANGVNNKLLHTRGTISMARAGDNDSASSQFFIMHAANHQLDGNYAAFGHVTKGIEVVDAICENVFTDDANGVVASANQPKITKVTVID